MSEVDMKKYLNKVVEETRTGNHNK